MKAEDKPRVGQMAWHKSGLDPRPVAEVSKTGKKIKLRIHTLVTDWVPASNYEFKD